MTACGLPNCIGIPLLQWYCRASLCFMKEVAVMLREARIMFVKELNAPKARIKLLIALNAGLPRGRH